MNDSKIGGIVAVAGIFSIALFVFFMVGYEIGVKRGQVDCINGEIYYELIVSDDKTSEWEYISQATRIERKREK